jgi:hypothetical protein
VRRSAAGAWVVLLSMSGFAGQVTGADTAVLWDRSHLKAAVCGLVTPQELEASSRALFSAVPRMRRRPGCWPGQPVTLQRGWR